MINKIKSNIKYIATGAGAIGSVAATSAAITTSAGAVVAKGAAIGAGIGAITGTATGYTLGGVGLLMSGGWAGFATIGLAKTSTPLFFGAVGTVVGSSVGANVASIGIATGLIATTPAWVAPVAIGSGIVTVAGAGKIAWDKYNKKPEQA